MVKHESGVMVLPAPLKPEFDDAITANHIKKILDILKEEFDQIIIDCPPILQDRVLMVLDMIFMKVTGFHYTKLEDYNGINNI
jgi:pilus assembly protein CpaE